MEKSLTSAFPQCFEGVQVLVFLAAVSEYDQQLWEDQSVNRLTEALMVGPAFLMLPSQEVATADGWS